MKRPLKINLQLFAEGAPAGGQAPSIAEQVGNIFNADSGVTPAPAPETPAQPQSPPAPQAQGNPTPEQAPAQQTPPAGTQPQQPPQQPQYGEFKSPDEVFKAYQNSRVAMTKTFMEKSNLSKENATLKAQLQELQSKANQPTIPQQPAQPQQPQAPEPVQINPEQYLEGFYKDPVGSIKKIVEETTKAVTEKVKAEVQAEYKPVLSKVEEREVQEHWGNAYVEFAQKTPDFEQHLDAVSEYMKRTGLGNEKDPAKIGQIIEDAYRWAKGGTAIQPPAQPVNPEDLLKDESFINKILSNQTIVQKAVAQHMASLQGNQPPPVISNAGGGAPAALPPERPKNFNDAAKYAGEIFDKHFG